MSEDKETPPIVFAYEERIAELEKENEQLKRINTLLEESNNFYGDKENWHCIGREGSYYGTESETNEAVRCADFKRLVDDFEYDLHINEAWNGKKARETAKQIDKIRSE